MKLASAVLAVSLSVLAVGPGSVRAQGSSAWVTAVEQRIDGLIKANDLTGALKEAESALSIASSKYGATSMEAAGALTLLGRALGSLAQHEKALPLMVRALGIREKVLGPEHPNTAPALGKLGSTDSDLARHDLALHAKAKRGAVLYRTGLSADTEMLAPWLRRTGSYQSRALAHYVGGAFQGFTP